MAKPPVSRVRVDNRLRRHLIRAVRFFRRMFVLLLLAAWVPAVLHCDLEAAGFAFATDCCEQTKPARADHCAPGRCEVAESDFTAPADGTAAISAPLLYCGVLAALVVPELSDLTLVRPEGIREADVAPPELAHRWAFVSRAAASPRAPSSVS